VPKGRERARPAFFWSVGESKPKEDIEKNGYDVIKHQRDRGAAGSQRTNLYEKKRTEKKRYCISLSGAQPKGESTNEIGGQYKSTSNFSAQARQERKRNIKQQLVRNGEEKGGGSRVC